MRRRTVLAAGLFLALLAAAAAFFTGGAERADRSRDDAASTRPSAPLAVVAAPADRRLPATAAHADTASRPGDALASVHGVVVDASGAGVAGASVAVTRADLPPASAENAPRTATTADGGRFAVDVADHAARYHVHAEAPSGASGVVEFARTDAAVVVTLEPPRSLSGRVMDRAGRPIAGARVRWMALVSGRPITRDATSAADGRYAIDGLPGPRALTLWEPEPPFWARCESDGFAPATVDADRTRRVDGGWRLDFVLTAGSTLQGRVTDADSGAPIAGARVLLGSVEGHQIVARGGRTVRLPLDASGLPVPPSFGALSPFAPRALAETKTDADGRYRFTGVPCDGPTPPSTSYGMEPKNARMPEFRGCLGFVAAFAPERAPEVRRVPVANEGATEEIDLACRGAAEVRGRVIDAQGAPVPGAFVWTRPFDDEVAWAALVDSTCRAPMAVAAADGRYRIAGLGAPRASDATLRLVGARAGGVDEGRLEVAIRGGAATDAPDLVLSASSPYVLRVTDPSGAPLPHATASDPEGPRTARWSADAAGRIDVRLSRDGDKKDLPRRLLIRAPGSAMTLTSPLDPMATSGGDLPVVLEPERRLRGRVLRGDGSPAPRALVVAAAGDVPDDELFPRRPKRDVFPLVADGALRRLAWTLADDAGEFELRECPSISLAVGAQPNEDKVAPERRVRVDVPAAQLASGAPIVLRLPASATADERARVEGTVTDDRGNPVVTFRVQISREGGPFHQRGASAPGAFEIDSIAPGTYSLRVTSDGFEPYTQPTLIVDAPPTTTRFDVRLKRKP